MRLAMADISRRGLFRLAGVAAVAPIVAKLPEAAASGGGRRYTPSELCTMSEDEWGDAMSPTTIDNSIRRMMAAVRRFQIDSDDQRSSVS